MGAPRFLHRCDDGRWETRFGRWVGEFGVSRIIEVLDPYPSLRVTHQAVYAWVACASAPNPRRAQALVRLSGGVLTLEVIYEHPRELRREHLQQLERKKTLRT